MTLSRSRRARSVREFCMESDDNGLGGVAWVAWLAWVSDDNGVGGVAWRRWRGVGE